MTDMKRITISLTDDQSAAIEQLSQTDEFRSKPYSKIIRELIERGLKAERAKGAKT